jgi:uncharacterized membrane protein
MMYAVATVVLGVFSPRLEYRYLSSYHHGMTVSAATAAFSAVASGMLALTAIVFSLAFVMVQFSSSAYSPRLVLWLSRDPIIWHAMGTFTATFLFALVALGWVDRNGSGHVSFFSTWVIIVLLVASVLVLARLVQRLTIFQVTEVLYYVSQRGRQVISEVYPPLATPEIAWEDFLMLAFEEIRLYGATSLQVMRRIHAALYDLARIVPLDRQESIHRYIAHLDTTIKASIPDPEDQREALQQDRQGLGLSRQPPLREAD